MECEISAARPIEIIERAPAANRRGLFMVSSPDPRPLSTPRVRGVNLHEGNALARGPALVFDADPGDLPVPDPDWVRVRSGVHAGLEGRLLAVIGPRRFAGNVMLEAARLAIDGAPSLDVPLGDLERFA